MFRSRRRLSTALGAALAIGALSAPAAHAVHSTAPAGSGPSVEPTVTRTVDEGFDLGSAAIGAGSAATILLLGGAGATMVAKRRRVRLPG
jgi:hypothetical protein